MIAAVRIRGHVNVNRDIESTMKMLNLARVNHCSLLLENPSYKGMIQRAKDYITYGKISVETLTQLIRERGRLYGEKPITDEYVKENTDYNSIKEFSKAVINEETKYKDLPDVKPIFRLHPPSGGFEGIKRSFTAGGALGNRNEEMEDLIKRMI